MSDPVDYLIVGSGVNGTSIAHTLVTLGFSVTLLDRSPDGFVAPDGASHDLNKIIRADYTDPNYCTLGKEAISRWRTSPVLHKYYHEVGVFFRSSDQGKVFGAEGSAEAYCEDGIRHARLERDDHLEIGSSYPGKQLKPKAFKFDSDDKVRHVMKGLYAKMGDGVKGMGKTHTGYFNPRGGWAEANNACRALLEHAIALGAKVHGNATVSSLIYSASDATKVTGVRTTDGRTFAANNVVLAAGAWTSDLLSTLTSRRLEAGSGWMTRPSAQCVAVLRVTEAEARELRDSPVIISFSTGFYLFEPVRVQGGEWHMKIAYHSNGYLYPKPPVECSGRYPSFEDSVASHPTGARAIGDEGTDEATRAEDVGYEMAESTIPASRLDTMLEELGAIYPHLAQKQRVVGTRVCWYSDTLDENWILDTLNHHPSSSDDDDEGADNVWVVSGDSGHAYKFLPMIGDLFATIAGLKPNTRKLDLTRFKFAHQANLHNDKRNGMHVQSADSNRFDATKLKENRRARL